MAIQLHSFVSSGKRYIQVESQPHHISGIFRTLMRSSNNRYFIEFTEISVFFECEEDGTITFYQAAIADIANSGIWTYLVYECSQGEEQIFRDSSMDTNKNSLNELFAGQKMVQVAVDINEYLNYQYNQDEYLDVQLPSDWNTQEGRDIANLLVEELKAFKASSVFAEGVGKEYRKAVFDGFIKAAKEVLEIGGTLKDFEAVQYDVLNKIRIDDMAKLILEYNDYRIWQAALPSKSKAVEYAFNNALSLICRQSGC